jgi:ABC-2 type transport system permease protein
MTGATGRAAMPATTVRATLALAATELRLASRRGESLLVTIVIPAAVLLFFAGSGVVPVAGRPVDFLLPGSLALAVIATSLVSLGIATAYERHYLVLKRLGGAPVSRASLIAAKMLAVLAVELAQLILLVGLAVGVLGWRPGDGWSPLLVGVGLALGTVAFAGLGLAMAGSLRAEATLAGANGLFLVLLMVGGIVLPVDHLAPFLQPLAAALPAAPLAEVLRVALGSGGDPGAALGELSVWAVALAGLAVATFHWE